MDEGFGAVWNDVAVARFCDVAPGAFVLEPVDARFGATGVGLRIWVELELFRFEATVGNGNVYGLYELEETGSDKDEMGDIFCTHR